MTLGGDINEIPGERKSPCQMQMREGDWSVEEISKMKTKGVLLDKDMDGALPIDVEIRCHGDEVRIGFGGKRGVELRVKREDLMVTLSQDEHG